MADEIRWIEASLRGEAAAFEPLVRKYQALVCAITFSGTGRVDVSEELAQETFLSAWRHLGQLKDPGGFRPWLCSIARNLIRNYYRQKQERCEGMELTDAADSAPDPQAALIAEEEHAMLEAALRRIPAEYREPLVLFYRQGQSTREVAAGLGLNESTVRTRLHRARQMLREEIAGRLERTLERTGPGDGFTKAVMVAVGGLAVGGAATAQGASASAGGAASTAAVGLGIKIGAALAAVVLGVAGIWVYRQWSGPAEATILQAISVEAVEPVMEAPEPTSAVVMEEPVEVVMVEAAVEEAPAEREVVVNETKREREEVKKTVSAAVEAEEAFVPRGVLSGLLTDAKTGKPLAGTEISVTNRRIYTARTDEHGFYSIEKVDKADNYEIAINSWDHVGISFNEDRPPTVRLENGKQVVRHFALEEACMVDLCVVDEAGEPLEGAHVHVCRTSDERGWPVGAEESGGNGNHTAADGHVLLGGFVPDTYLITIQHTYDVKDERRDVWTHRFDYAPAGLEVTLRDRGRVVPKQVVLERGQQVRGYVEYKDGEPASDIEIVPVPQWWKANRWIPSFAVEPNGFFTLDYIVPGDYDIQAKVIEGDGWSSRRVLTTALPLEGDEVLHVTLPMQAPSRLASISGSLEWIGKDRPRYMEIRAYSEGGGSYSTSLYDFEENTFCIERMKPGLYQLDVSGDTLKPLTMKVAAPTEGLVLEVTCSGKPTLRGMVRDGATKTPVKAFRLRVLKKDTLRGPHWSQDDHWMEFENTAGTFEVEAVGPGVYLVQALAEGYAPAWSGMINTDESGAAVVDLMRGGAIRGIVVNEAGEPVTGAKVIPLSLARGMDLGTFYEFAGDGGAVRTDGAGRFMLEHVPAGGETLKTLHPDYAFAVTEGVAVEEGQVSGDVRVVLREGGTVEGVVYDAEGTPAGGIELYVQDRTSYGSSDHEAAGRYAVARTEPNGFYQVSGLPERVCYIKRPDEWNTMGVVWRAVVPRSGQTCRADMGGAGPVLRGQLAVDGEAPSLCRVILGQALHAGEFRAVAMTDEEGRFEFYGVRPGRLMLMYEKKDPPADWVKVADVHFGTEDVDLGVITPATERVSVTIEQPGELPSDVQGVYLMEGHDLRGGRMVSLQAPAEVGGPYTALIMTPGDHQVVVYRADGVVFRERISIPAGEEEVSLTVRLPEGLASISGRIPAEAPMVVLWSEDQSVQAAVQRPADGRYAFHNLPMGDYRLSLSASMEEAGSIPVTLLRGQRLELDIDGQTFTEEPRALGMLMAAAVDEKGIPVNGIEITLRQGEQIVKPRIGEGWQASFVASAGEYILRAEGEGYETAERKVWVKDMSEGILPRINEEQVVIIVKPVTRR